MFHFIIVFNIEIFIFKLKLNGYNNPTQYISFEPMIKIVTWNFSYSFARYIRYIINLGESHFFFITT